MAPVKHAATALLSVAADPATRSPARLAEAGPWWDETPGVSPGHEPQATAADLTNLEAELDATNGSESSCSDRLASNWPEPGNPSPATRSSRQPSTCCTPKARTRPGTK